MDVRSLHYRDLSARILRDTPEIRNAVTGATLHFELSRQRGYGGIDSEAWRRWAESVKNHLLTHLDQHLEAATRNLEANGVHVHWAATAADAHDVLRGIASQHGVRRAVKGKSMLSEELEVNELLAHIGVQVFETDLGEYILQMLNEPPSHILGPAIHRNLEQVRAIFHERLGTALDDSPDRLAAAARKVLRAAFLTADLGITGANFVVAETGTIALIENEGNIRLSTALPRVHVALVGIEKLLPRWSDLAPFLQLASRAATGQTVGTFVTLIRSPRMRGPDDEAAEGDGPDEVHVVFVDNGRTRVLADPVAWETLRCVRCGACLNICPVYRQTGGHAYGWVYSGPIGAVLNPGLLGLEQAHTLPFASTLCGACQDACPVRIPIPRLLLEWRKRAAEAGHRPAAEARTMHRFANAATRPARFQRLGRWFAATPRFLRQTVPLLRDWAALRAPLEPAFRSFLSRWKKEAGPAPSTTPRSNFAAAPPAAAQTHPPVLNQELANDSPATTRRAFAGGTLGRTRAPSHSGPIDNVVMRAVKDALVNRARLAHPGPLIARDTVATPTTATHAERVHRFARQFRANGGEVVELKTLQEAVAWLELFSRDFLTAAVSLLVPDRLSPLGWGVEVAAPETAQLGVSHAIGAAAETGTLLLDSRERRALQLLPPVHLVWVRESRIAATLAQALDSVHGELPAALGLHSGPSRSADIGRVIVTGVHGPGRLIAAILP